MRANKIANCVLCYSLVGWAGARVRVPTYFGCGGVGAWWCTHHHTTTRTCQPATHPSTLERVARD
jgi:hypothetical protein